jgi:hypothetical protein
MQSGVAKPDPLTALIERTRGNDWLVYPGGHKVYLRIGQRYFGDDFKPCLDLGALQLNKRHKVLVRAMWLLKWVRQVEAECDKRGLYLFIENIYTKSLVTFFANRGYVSLRRQTAICPPSCYRTPR